MHLEGQGDGFSNAGIGAGYQDAFTLKSYIRANLILATILHSYIGRNFFVPDTIPCGRG
jgi:hypothetical protein